MGGVGNAIVQHPLFFMKKTAIQIIADTVAKVSFHPLVSFLFSEAVKAIPFLAWGPMGWLTKMAIQWGVEKAYTAGKIEISVIESNREILNNIAKEKDTVKKYDKAKTKKEKKRLVNDLTKDGITAITF